MSKEKLVGTFLLPNKWKITKYQQKMKFMKSCYLFIRY